MHLLVVSHQSIYHLVVLGNMEDSGRISRDRDGVVDIYRIDREVHSDNLDDSHSGEGIDHTDQDVAVGATGTVGSASFWQRLGFR